MQYPDVVIAGSGVTGLALALTLRRRGRSVLLRYRNEPGLASRAAAGMLAARDPHHPAPLQPLADMAAALYPDFLATVREQSGRSVPIQTEHVLQSDQSGAPGHSFLPTLSPAAGLFTLQPEQSLDPRDLHTSLLAAADHAGVRFQCLEPGNAETLPTTAHATGQQFVDCTGAWSPTHARPAKGQMLRVRLPPDTLRLPGNGNAVVRTDQIYLVPRMDGTALIGATVEDAGFDLTNHDADLLALREKAAALLPQARHAAEVERWSGLRPRTTDELPVLGEIQPGQFVANGLFRNGILLAPAIAHVMAQMLCGEPISVLIADFSPHRTALALSR